MARGWYFSAHGAVAGKAAFEDVAERLGMGVKVQLQASAASQMGDASPLTSGVMTRQARSVAAARRSSRSAAQ